MLKPPALAGRALLSFGRVAGLGLAGLGGFVDIAAAQTSAPPLTTAEVRPSPIHAIPDGPAEAPDGESALAAGAVAAGTLAAGAPAGGAAPAAGTLNAQMAALRRAAAGPEASPGPNPSAAPATPAPTVAIARRVMDAAAAFDSYVHRASAITPDVHDGPGRGGL
jgi:hypothetical protein